MYQTYEVGESFKSKQVHSHRFKRQAKHGGWRVPEKTLQGTAALGGWPAGSPGHQGLGPSRNGRKSWENHGKIMGTYVKDVEPPLFLPLQLELELAFYSWENQL